MQHLRGTHNVTTRNLLCRILDDRCPQRLLPQRGLPMRWRIRSRVRRRLRWGMCHRCLRGSSTRIPERWPVRPRDPHDGIRRSSSWLPAGCSRPGGHALNILSVATRTMSSDPPTRCRRRTCSIARVSRRVAANPEYEALWPEKFAPQCCRHSASDRTHKSLV